MEARFIGEVDYPQRLTNVFLVIKANRRWRLCVDFINFNKARPKDCFPSLPIDRVVYAIMDFRFLSTLDVLIGYH